jgi:hypothetical protein
MLSMGDNTRSAAETGRDDYLQQMQNVEKECQDIHDFLRGLPIHISEDLTLIIRIIDIIVLYDPNNITIFKVASSYDDEEYNAVCRNMLRSVLFPSTTHYDTTYYIVKVCTEDNNSNYGKFPQFNFLFFGTKTEIGLSTLVARNVHYLNKLLLLTYLFYCADEVLEQV